MKDFNQKVIKQCERIFAYDFETETKELIMAVFMQMFSYKFDDKIDKTIKFNNIDNITKKVWLPIKQNKTNELVGIPIFLNADEETKFYSYDLNDKTKYILHEIRCSIVHGAFSINDDGTITIFGKSFQMTFEFDCIIDICSIIVKQLEITDDKVNDLNNFADFIRKSKTKDFNYNKAMIDFNYTNYKYPIILFNMLPMNEDEFHNDNKYSNFIVDLFSNRELYKNGRFKDEQTLQVKELYKWRNCIAHGQYYFDNDDLILFDHKETFIFNCKELDMFFDKENLEKGISAK